MRIFRLRAFAALVFYFAIARAAREVPPVHAVRTEEGQMVVFDRITWQMRELSKKLPLSETWPSGGAALKAFEKYGLDRNPPPAAIPVPSTIARDVYLVGQDHVSNLTYMIDCGTEGVAGIPPAYQAQVAPNPWNGRECRRARTEVGSLPNTAR